MKTKRVRKRSQDLTRTKLFQALISNERVAEVQVDDDEGYDVSLKDGWRRADGADRFMAGTLSEAWKFVREAEHR
jgi:hypothetical protein